MDRWIHVLIKSYNRVNFFKHLSWCVSGAMSGAMPVAMPVRWQVWTVLDGLDLWNGNLSLGTCNAASRETACVIWKGHGVVGLTSTHSTGSDTKPLDLYPTLEFPQEICHRRVWEYSPLPSWGPCSWNFSQWIRGLPLSDFRSQGGTQSAVCAYTQPFSLLGEA